MSNVWTDELRTGKGKVDKGRKLPEKTRVADLVRMAGKTPEVVIQISASKVTAKSGKVSYPSPRDAAALKGLVEYVSRVADSEKDDLEMFDELGLSYSGRAELEAAVQHWKMPKQGNRREVLHVVMSMPRDAPDGSLTNVAAVERAATATAEKIFKGHHFLMTHHRDGERGNPHAHILVRMDPISSGKRLNPKKADLQRYRETYAAALRDNGVLANATAARQRFSRTRNLKQADYQLNAARDKEYNTQGLSARRVQRNKKPDDEQFRAHMAAVKVLAETGQGAEARKVMRWLNTAAPVEAEAYRQSDNWQMPTHKNRPDQQDEESYSPTL